MIEEDIKSVEDVSLEHLAKANRQIVRFVVTATLVITVALFVMVGLALREVSRTSTILKAQNQGLLDYLSCVGKLPLKAEARTPDKIQACVELYTKRIKG